MSLTNWVFRFGLGSILIWQSYSIMRDDNSTNKRDINQALGYYHENFDICLLYTSPSPRDRG